MKISNQVAKNETAGSNDAKQYKNENSQRLAQSSCKAILNTGGIHYTDEEILAIRDFLYQLAGYTTEQHLLEQEATNNESNQLNHTKYEKSVFVYPCKYRRAGRKRVQPAASGRKVAALLPVEQY